MDAVASAVEASGLRAVVGHSLFDRTAEADLAASERLIERFGTDPTRSRVWAGLAPHATDTCGPELLRRVRRLADRTGARVFIHVAQSQDEVARVIARGAAGCASYLDALGLLAPDVVAAHATYVSDAEADLLGSRRTAVAHCPSSNAKLEGRVAPIARMLRAGAVVGLGTDAACCNNGMDLFEEMKVAGLLNKVAADDPAAFPTLDLLRMATSEAARALGIDHLVGSLEPGKRADIIAVRHRGARLQPWSDPAANLVYAARGTDVTAVFVEGRQLVRDGRPVFLDTDRILADAAEVAGRLTHA
jgi:5-methylthioadenosine/S-adenosylhomocysteine deaminase